MAGDYYVNVHTPANPGGEIRGQVGMAMPRMDSHALLTGGEKTRPSTPTPWAWGTFHLSADLSTLDFHLAVADIENVTAAHLHTGWPGVERRRGLCPVPRGPAAAGTRQPRPTA